MEPLRGQDFIPITFNLDEVHALRQIPYVELIAGVRYIEVFHSPSNQVEDNYFRNSFGFCQADIVNSWVGIHF